MVKRMKLAQAKALLPLLKSISSEVRERRSKKDRLEVLRKQLFHASKRISPEGFICSLQDVEAEIHAQRRGIESALKELESLGLEVPSIEPMVIYIPGESAGNEVIFYWEEGESRLESNTLFDDDSDEALNPEVSEQNGST